MAKFKKFSIVLPSMKEEELGKAKKKKPACAERQSEAVRSREKRKKAGGSSLIEKGPASGRLVWNEKKRQSAFPFQEDLGRRKSLMSTSAKRKKRGRNASLVRSRPSMTITTTKKEGRVLTLLTNRKEKRCRRGAHPPKAEEIAEIVLETNRFSSAIKKRNRPGKKKSAATPTGMKNGLWSRAWGKRENQGGGRVYVVEWSGAKKQNRETEKRSAGGETENWGRLLKT